MRLTALATLFALALTAFLVALVPASWVLREAEARSGQRFAAFEEHGTLWSGSARVRLATPTGVVTIERVQWRLRPASLLGARLGFQVHVEQDGIKLAGEVARGFGGWELLRVNGEAHAPSLASWVPLAAAWKPEGRLELVAPRLAFDGTRLQGNAEIVWRDAGLALAAVKPLGSYRLEVAASGSGPAALALSTMSGPLSLAGKGQLSRAGALSLSGEARAEGPQAAQLQPVLDLLGPRRPDGSRALELRLP